MTAPVFVANVVVAALASGLCLSHAYPDRDRLAMFATALFYGVLLEQLVIRAFEAYRYNLDGFVLVVGDVPVVVGVGWAVIIYTGVQIGRHLAIGDRVLPFFVALYALHIDLAIDAVAIRVPFWTWAGGGPWFGVPLSNFVGWFLVAALFTGAWLVLERQRRRWLRVGATIPISVVGLLGFLQLWSEIAHAEWVRVGVLGGLVALSTVLVARDRPAFTRIDPRIGLIPPLFHLFYLAILLGYGMYRDQPLLLVVSLGLLALGSLLHLGTTAYAPRGDPDAVEPSRTREPCRRTTDPPENR